MKLCEICKDKIEEDRDICDFCIQQVLKKKFIGEDKDN